LTASRTIMQKRGLLCVLLVLSACGARSGLDEGLLGSGEAAGVAWSDSTAATGDATERDAFSVGDGDPDAGTDTAGLDGSVGDGDADARIDATGSDGSVVKGQAADASANPCGDHPLWTQLAPSGTAPVGRVYHSAIMDTSNGRMVVFGGESARMGTFYGLADSWALTQGPGAGWSSLNPAGAAPSARDGASAVYDPVRQRLVLFGGSDAPSSRLNDVWLLDLGAAAAWSKASPTGTPPTPRTLQMAIYDEAQQRLIVFGGDDGLGGVLKNDVWALSMSGSPTWTQLFPTGPAPPAREFGSVVYDAAHTRAIVFGGEGPLPFNTPGSPTLDSGSPTLNDVWALSLSGAPAWTRLTPTGAGPVARWEHAAVYDSACQQMIVFGGDVFPSADRVGNDAWSLSLSGVPAWTKLAPSGTLPLPRLSHTAVWDSATRQMIVFGGLTFGGVPPVRLSNEVWSLSGL
jgi:galactose oxidase-like protein